MACIRYPVLIILKCREGAEGISRKQYLLALLIGYHDLRPVHHRSHNKLKRVASQGQCVILLHRFESPLKITLEELRDKLSCRGAAYKLHVRIHIRKLFDIRGMIRLHMLYN